MQAATIHQLKKELNSIDPSELTAHLIRLAKHKKENKELLSYLLFEAHDEEGYIESAKGEIEDQFEEINHRNLYWAKKTVRKILRGMNKYIRFSGLKTTEITLLIFFCTKLKEAKLVRHGSVQLDHIYESQVRKIKKAMDKLDEDLQYDYHHEISAL